MKNYFKTFLILVAVSISSDIKAQAYNSAVGGRLGTFFTGSYKKFISERNALEAIAGFDRNFGATALALGAYFQIHNDLELDGAEFQWYYGFGGHVTLGDFSGVVPSGIVGLEYTLSDSPVNFFIDIIPGIYIGSATEFEVNGSIGARYILN